MVQFYPWFKFSFLLFLGMVMYDNNMIMSLKQKKRKFEPRIKLNHNISTRQLVEDVMSTGLTNTHMACGFCITCLLKNNVFSVLHYITNVALHYYMLHQSKIFSAPGTIAHVSIRLSPRSLASSRGCLLAISYLVIQKK